MISYCIAAFRPPYAKLLIEDLIRKATGPCEILVWINSADESFVQWVKEKQASGTPVRLIGWTPENIGMKSFKNLFQSARYEMLVQIDDDVLRVSPRIPEIAKDIFSRHKPVKQLVADVIQDPYTTGAKGGPQSYQLYNGGDRLYLGPIDGWFSIYHRSIMPLLMMAPYDRYFYLGAHVAGVLKGSGLLGCLCARMKVFHVAGPVYAHHFGMLDGEVEKFRRANMNGMAEGYKAYGDHAHPRDTVETQLQMGFQHIDAYDIPVEVQSAMQQPNLEEALNCARTINDHYGLSVDDLQVVFNLAKDCAPGSVLVEIGICHGRTSSVLAYIAKHRHSEYHGIDIFGYDGNSKAGVQESLHKLGLTAHLHEGSSNRSGTTPLACPTWDKPINFLFIDGGHDEANVRGDCEIWLPRLVSGGIVIFDDWNELPAHSNAHWAIKHYADLHCAGWEVLRTNQKLHVRRKP